MTAQVAAINGADEMLQGGYAQVSGYTYATPPCTSGACTSQDLDTLAASLEETLISICVNAENWNDYIGGVMSSAQRGGMDADDQDHCVIGNRLQLCTNTLLDCAKFLVFYMGRIWLQLFGHEH